jgi:hypothetical protein
MEDLSLAREEAIHQGATAGANPVQPGAVGDSLCGCRWAAESAACRAGVGGDRRAVGPGGAAAV